MVILTKYSVAEKSQPYEYRELIAKRNIAI